MRADWMYEKSKDVGHVESNALAKGRPFVCLKIIFWQTSSALKNTTRWAAICRPRRTERRCHRAVRDDQKEFRMDGIICLVVKSVKFNFQLAISVGECYSSVNPRKIHLFVVVILICIYLLYLICMWKKTRPQVADVYILTIRSSGGRRVWHWKCTSHTKILAWCCGIKKKTKFLVV